MSTYKLRHFATFLFQMMNQGVKGLPEIFASARGPYLGSLDTIAHAEGVKLILSVVDQFYYLDMNGYSLGMYLTMLREETGRPGALMQPRAAQATSYDPLFDDF